MMGWNDKRFASGAMVPWRNVAGASALLQELFDHAKRDAIASPDLLASAFLIVVRSQDSFTQIH
jgi:hypothetical protein